MKSFISDIHPLSGHYKKRKFLCGKEITIVAIDKSSRVKGWDFLEGYIDNELYIIAPVKIIYADEYKCGWWGWIDSHGTKWKCCSAKILCFWLHWHKGWHDSASLDKVPFTRIRRIELCLFNKKLKIPWRYYDC